MTNTAIFYDALLDFVAPQHKNEFHLLFSNAPSGDTAYFRNLMMKWFSWRGAVALDYDGSIVKTEMPIDAIDAWSALATATEDASSVHKLLGAFESVSGAYAFSENMHTRTSTIAHTYVQIKSWLGAVRLVESNHNRLDTWIEAWVRRMPTDITPEVELMDSLADYIPVASLRQAFGVSFSERRVPVFQMQRDIEEWLHKHNVDLPLTFVNRWIEIIPDNYTKITENTELDHDDGCDHEGNSMYGYDHEEDDARKSSWTHSEDFYDGDVITKSNFFIRIDSGAFIAPIYAVQSLGSLLYLTHDINAEMLAVDKVEVAIPNTDEISSFTVFTFYVKRDDTLSIGIDMEIDNTAPARQTTCYEIVRTAVVMKAELSLL